MAVWGSAGEGKIIPLQPQGADEVTKRPRGMLNPQGDLDEEQDTHES